MCLRSRFLFFIIILMSFTSCFKRQKHEILPPESPRFDVSGQIFDYDSQEPLANVIMKITSVTSQGQDTFSTLIDTTNSSGNYILKEIPVGNYELGAYRSGNVVENIDIIISNDHRIVDLFIPKPYVCQKRYGKVYGANHDSLNFEGIFWISDGVLIGIATWPLYPPRKRIFRGNCENGFLVMGEERYENEINSFSGITRYNGAYWSCNEKTIIGINQETSQPEGVIITEHLVADLTNDQKYLWISTQDNYIFRCNRHPSVIEREYKMAALQLGGIAWDGKNLFVADVKQSFIYQLDEELKIISTYRAVFNDGLASWWIDCSFLSFDLKSHLWANSGGFLYEFEKNKN